MNPQVDSTTPVRLIRRRYSPFVNVEERGTLQCSNNKLKWICVILYIYTWTKRHRVSTICPSSKLPILLDLIATNAAAARDKI